MWFILNRVISRENGIDTAIGGLQNALPVSFGFNNIYMYVGLFTQNRYLGTIPNSVQEIVNVIKSMSKFGTYLMTIIACTSITK